MSAFAGTRHDSLMASMLFKVVKSLPAMRSIRRRPRAASRRSPDTLIDPSGNASFAAIASRRGASRATSRSPEPSIASTLCPWGQVANWPIAQSMFPGAPKLVCPSKILERTRSIKKREGGTGHIFSMPMPTARRSLTTPIAWKVLGTCVEAFLQKVLRLRKPQTRFTIDV